MADVYLKGEELEVRKLCLLVFLCLFVLWAPERSEAKRIMTVKIGRGEARITYLEGTAQAIDGQKAPRFLKVNDVVKKGDEIKTGQKSKLELLLGDKSQLRFADNSHFKILQVDADEEQARYVKVHLALGKAWANVRKAIAGKQNFALTCENAVAGVRGTIYRMNVHEDGSAMVRVYDGTVYVAGGGGAALEAPKVIGPPQKIEGPKPIAGPKKVTMEEWTFIIRAMQQIVIGSDGTPGQPQDFTEQQDRDEWVDWNKAQDSDPF